MKLTKSNIKKFNDINKNVINTLNFDKGHAPHLNGSYPLTLWASDIDLYQKVPANMLIPLIESLKDILKDIKKDDIIEFKKIKLGMTPVRDFKRAQKVLNDVPLIEKLVFATNINWVKLDIFVFNGEYIEDITIIYDLNNHAILNDKEIKQMFFDEFKLYVNKKQYVKALKRLNKIEKIYDDVLENTFVGFGYLTMSRLKTLEESKMNSEIKKFVLSNLKEDITIKLGAYDESLKNIKLNYLQDIPKAIQLINKKLNEKVSIFVNKKKLK